MKTLSQYILESNNLEMNGFVILKPGFLDYKDDFLALLKNNGWNIIQQTECKLTKEQAKETVITTKPSIIGVVYSIKFICFIPFLFCNK